MHILALIPLGLLGNPRFSYADKSDCDTDSSSPMTEETLESLEGPLQPKIQALWILNT